MKPDLHHLDKYRERSGRFASPMGARYGVFAIPVTKHGGGEEVFIVVASDGEDDTGKHLGWEHVSVHVAIAGIEKMSRTPTWREMCQIKQLFWGDEEVVVQFHIDGTMKVNLHPCTLHIWKCVGKEFPTPDPKMV